MVSLNAEAQEILSFWQDVKGSDSLPDKKVLSGSNLRRWISDISVIHVHDGPKRFFVSLHGANVHRHIGPDFNKKYLEDVIPSAFLSWTLAPYQESMERAAPVYAEMMPTFGNGLYSAQKRLILPFCGGRKGVVERFLVWVVPDDKNAGSQRLIDDQGGTLVPDSAYSLFVFEGGQPVKINFKKKSLLQKSAQARNMRDICDLLFQGGMRYGFR